MKKIALLRLVLYGFIFGILVAHYLRVENVSRRLEKFEAEESTYRNEINGSVNELFLMHVISGRQIRTLFNIHLREENPEIQKKLQEVRDKYKELDRQDEN